MPSPNANIRAVLATARAAIAQGWRPGESRRLPDGSIEWSVEGALRRALFRQGITTPEAQAQAISDALAALNVAGFDELEKSGGQPKARAAVLAALDAAQAQAQAKRGG